MEEENQNLAFENKELFAFREEIARIAAEEATIHKTANFRNPTNFNPQELTVEDMNIWEKTRAETITEEEFNIYRSNFKEQGGYASDSRCGFLSVVGNRASAIIGERWLAEQKKKKQ